MSAGPVSKIELRFSCKNLPSMDVMSKTDPLVHVSLISGSGDGAVTTEVGSTERVKNDENPVFTTSFTIDYYFEIVQKLHLVVYDSDGPGKREYIAEATVVVADVVCAGAKKFKADLHDAKKPEKKHRGEIYIAAEEVKDSKVGFEMWFKGTNLDKKDFFGKSDPFYKICRQNADGSFTPAFTSEIIKNTLNPVWASMKSSARELVNGDLDRAIRIEVYDWDRDGSHDLIGITENTTLRSLIDPNTKRDFRLVNAKKAAKSAKYTDSGILTLYKVQPVPPQASFVDYLAGGAEINFTVAVDFTASNGTPTNSTSLHYISPFQMNEYQQAIFQVGTVVAPYDFDKLFPSFGFGGKLPDGSVSHEFALNGNPTNPYCVGVDGIMAAYAQAIRVVQLWGPTNFAPIINQVARFAREADKKIASEQKYFILLIITDGVISDMDATMDAIIGASTLPLSIIIVGVGNADFDAMNTLDGDVVPIKFNGKTAARDIVQFVPFSQYRGKNPAELASNVLAEVPQQFLSYMKLRNVQPIVRA